MFWQPCAQCKNSQNYPKASYKKHADANKKACKVNNYILLLYKQKWDENCIKIRQDKESGQNATFDVVVYSIAEQTGNPLSLWFSLDIA